MLFVQIRYTKRGYSWHGQPEILNCEDLEAVEERLRLCQARSSPLEFPNLRAATYYKVQKIFDVRSGGVSLVL